MLEYLPVLLWAATLRSAVGAAAVSFLICMRIAAFSGPAPRGWRGASSGMGTAASLLLANALCHEQAYLVVVVAAACTAISLGLAFPGPRSALLLGGVVAVASISAPQGALGEPLLWLLCAFLAAPCVGAALRRGVTPGEAAVLSTGVSVAVAQCMSQALRASEAISALVRAVVSAARGTLGLRARGPGSAGAWHHLAALLRGPLSQSHARSRAPTDGVRSSYALTWLVGTACAICLLNLLPLASGGGRSSGDEQVDAASDTDDTGATAGRTGRTGRRRSRGHIRLLRAAALGASAGGCVALVAFPALSVLCGGNPVLWVLDFVSSDVGNALVVSSWVAALVLFLSWLESRPLAAPRAPSLSLWRQRIVVRKFFHFLALGMFLPAELARPTLLHLAYGVAFAALLLVELARAARVPAVAPLLDGFFLKYADARDGGPLILTHIMLLLGCALPAWTAESLRLTAVTHWGVAAALPACASAVLLPVVGVVALGAGDSAAALVGRAWGRRFLYGSRKTAEGTAAGAGAMLLSAGAFLAAHDLLWPHAAVLPRTTWAELLYLAACLVLTAVVEATTDQLDNLVLPLFATPLVCWGVHFFAPADIAAAHL